MFRNRFMCALAIIDMLLCLLVTVRYSYNLIQANETTKQLMEQLGERSNTFKAALEQLIELDHEILFAIYGQKMKPVSYAKAAGCLKTLESLNTSKNFDHFDIERIEQIINKGHSLITMPQSLDLELGHDYQEMIKECVKSLEVSSSQYESKMIKNINLGERDIICSAIGILVSVVISATIVIALLVFSIKWENSQELNHAKRRGS